MMLIGVGYLSVPRYLLNFCPLCIGDDLNTQTLGIQPRFSSDCVVSDEDGITFTRVLLVVLGASENLLNGVITYSLVIVLALNVVLVLGSVDGLSSYDVNASIVLARLVALNYALLRNSTVLCSKSTPVLQSLKMMSSFVKVLNLLFFKFDT